MTDAMRWWTSLSMNEQDEFQDLHPYYNHFGAVYVAGHKTAVEEIYNLIKEVNND